MIIDLIKRKEPKTNKSKLFNINYQLHFLILYVFELVIHICQLRRNYYFYQNLKIRQS
jgi:hypothetical protein